MHRPQHEPAHSRRSIKWHLGLTHDVTGAPGLKWYLNVLIGVSVAFVLLPLVLLVRHRGQSRRRKSGE